jgi:hypothetical protein
MAYNLQTSQTAFKGGKNILASEHVQFIEGGATVKAGEGVLAVGTAIARETATGKFVAYSETTPGTLEPGHDEFSILNVEVDATNYDAVVGEVIVRGSVYDAKLEANVSDAFKAANKNIRYVKHI